MTTELMEVCLLQTEVEKLQKQLREAKQPRPRRISGMSMMLLESDAEKLIGELEKPNVGGLKFGAEITERMPIALNNGKQWVCIDVWADVTAEDIENLALQGFQEEVDRIARCVDIERCHSCSDGNFIKIAYDDPVKSTALSW
jgi:hypothetical protein